MLSVFAQRGVRIRFSGFNGLKRWDADESTDGAQPLPPTVVQQLLVQPAAHFRNIFQEVGLSAAALQNLDEEQR